jgi:hypothetical protein
MQPIWFRQSAAAGDLFLSSCVESETTENYAQSAADEKSRLETLLEAVDQGRASGLHGRALRLGSTPSPGAIDTSNAGPNSGTCSERSAGHTATARAANAGPILHAACEADACNASHAGTAAESARRTQACADERANKRSTQGVRLQSQALPGADHQLVHAL